MINKQNIEEYFFDYFEGNLSTEQKSAVDSFLKDNPEFQADYNAWRDAYLPQENFVYQHADELIRSEGLGRRAFFARWKSSLLMLLVGTGMSAGVYYMMQTNQPSDKHLSDRESKGNDLTEANNTVIAPNSSNNNSSENSNGDRILKEQITALKNNEKLNDRMSSAAQVAVHANRDNKNEEKGSPINSGGKQTSVASRSSDHSSNIASSGQKGNLNSSKEKASSSLKTADLAASGLQELGWSAPDLTKGRNSLEKYDKNVVKFQNNGDPHLNVPNTSALEANGAFAGNGNGVRVNYLYNVQWPELNDYFSTHKASVDAYVKALRGGVGVIFTNDVLGHNKFTTNSIGFVYSPKFKLGSSSSVEPFVNYTYTQKSISWNQIKNKEVIDPRVGLLDAFVENSPENVAKSKAGYSDAGLGFLVNTSKLYFGFSYQGLLNPTYDFDGFSSEMKVPGKFTAQVGGSVVPFKQFENFVLSPSVYFVKLGAWDDLWFTNVIEISKLFIGTSISLNSDSYFSLGYDNDRLRVSYNYGLAKAPVNMTKHLSVHQLGLTFCLNKTK